MALLYFKNFSNFRSQNEFSFGKFTVIQTPAFRPEIITRGFAKNLSKKKLEAKEKEKQKRKEAKLKMKETKKKIAVELAEAAKPESEKTQKVKKAKKERVKPEWLKKKRSFMKKHAPTDILKEIRYHGLFELNLFHKRNNIPSINVQQLNNHLTSSLIIDLRDRIRDGDIPFEGSKRIPVKGFGDKFPKALLENELRLSEAEFQKRFGFSKPSKDTKILFVSELGKRSAVATKTALSLGYNNVTHLYGGYRMYFKYNPDKFQPSQLLFRRLARYSFKSTLAEVQGTPPIAPEAPAEPSVTPEAPTQTAESNAPLNQQDTQQVSATL